VSFHPERISLAARVLLIALVGTTAALAATVIVVQRTVGAQLRQSYLEQSRTTAGTIAGVAIDALITEDGPLLQTIAEQVVGRDRRIRAIVIENESGMELAAAGGESTAEGHLQFAERLEYGGEEFGRVTITWSTAGFYAVIDQTARQVAIWGGLILLSLAAILVVGLHRLVVAPLQGIVAFLQSVHAETSTPDIPVQHSPEMQYLANQTAGIAALVDNEKRLRSQAVDDTKQLRLLLHEVDHRVKNNLAAIVGLIRRGAVSAAGSSADLADGLIDRIMSMSRTHEALAQAGWAGVSLTEDLPHILDVAGDGDNLGQVRFTGPPLTVPPDEAMPLCMALSELMVNAKQHGSLGVVGGRVELAWTHEESGLRIDWKELGGPPVVPPGPEREIRSGLILVHGFIEYQLGGSVEIDFCADGFAAMFRVPLPRTAVG
jgi:two-component sensor histidine kinase